MADITHSPPRSAAMDPSVIKSILIAFFTAGAAALLAFDFFGQALSPMLGFAQLAPVGLANGTIKAVFGAGYKPGAEALHYFAGLVAYPIGWAMIGEPLRQRILPSMPWLIASALYGVALWVFALFIMAHLIVGMPAFLGFTGITWVALVGHVLYGVVFAAVWQGLRPNT